MHSYLGYGLKAARMSFLKPFDSVEEGHPCMTRGYEGRYHYVDENVSVKSDDEVGASVEGCVAAIEREMNLEEGCGVEGQCSFDGVWSGGGGGGAGAQLRLLLHCRHREGRGSYPQGVHHERRSPWRLHEGRREGVPRTTARWSRLTATT